MPEVKMSLAELRADYEINILKNRIKELTESLDAEVNKKWYQKLF